MAESRMRISIYKQGQDYQVRIRAFSGKDEKLLQEKLNLFRGEEALRRMEGYEDLRNDEYFVKKGATGPELCFTCQVGRLVRLRELIDETKGAALEIGAEHLPSTEQARRALTFEDQFTEELTHIIESNLPFYKQGPKALAKGLGLRLGALVLLAIVARAVYIARADHYVPRSLQAIMKTAETPHVGQNYLATFIRPAYTHQSKLIIKRPLYIRGNRVILEGGFFVQIDGIGNLKASIEAHDNAPVTLRVDTRQGALTLAGIYVGEDLVAPKGELRYLGKVPVAGAAPHRVDALDTEAQGAYVRVRDADPEEDGTFGWMLGQTVSVTGNVTNDIDRYLIGTSDFSFAIARASIKPEIQEILDMAAGASERAIIDMRLAARPFLLIDRRNPREDRRETRIITAGNAHYITLQSAVLKNI
ncbi:hypothetical protein FJ251_09875 [bacterium]|nr:hypothetical protein [bacterium]